MKFIDEAIIKVKAGDGGSGCKHFRREKYIPYGGPDGGDGGHGGSVVLVADRNKSTLLDFQFKPRWEAESGEKGQGANKEGKSGEDLIIKVPVGTEVYRMPDLAPSDSQEKEFVVDLAQDGESYIIARGGRGGKGNDFFKSPTNRAPDYFQPGEKGVEGNFQLSLKLVAEVGLIGLPNAGKSTLISRISASRPKIADYPFTTLTPNLGVAQLKGGRSFVVADIPGLIPGAHQGKGLGIKFLKHIERTKVLAHLLDPCQLDETGQPVPLVNAFETINRELELFSADLAKKPQVVVITKIDSITENTEIEAARKAFEDRGYKCLLISSVSGAGLEQLLDTLADLVRTAN